MARDDIKTKIEMMKPSIFKFETDIIWFNALQIFLLHAIGIYGLLTFNYWQNLITTIWIIAMYIISNIGVSGGAHRLWTHKSYKAKLPLRILLLICFSAGVQNTICSWVKNHRMHHKYCDTNADPHTSQRGFFYGHVGWVFMKEHPEFIKKSKQLDLSDILSDPVVVFGERNIKPSDNDFINFLTIGEGYHNFHHVFPWDYRSSEKGNNRFNYTTFFIDICAKLGQAYDLKYPSENLIKSIVLNNGDGTHPILSEVPIPESD
ncbi:PREDICTED: delta(9)-fatty-acid desaturase fat-6-like isoform X3 [Acromyrmex echinatior]|uniref:delta(9)-fatty-acid desaturase fat-6-like isoform X3 n=1 Tax=Acromyrmex echinatior TaxID=103372 RepID=UPI000580CB9E|nr:PREDICTED: delta(9)-fatty-acid desaturase fat-6-like isoform X3 [Acromyrmex echinatior]